MKIRGETLLALILPALLATGCISVLPDAKPAAARYQLSHVAIEAGDAPVVEWSLSIDDPTATRTHDTSMIVLIREDARVEYFSGAEWVDRAPRLFAAALVRSFENSGRIRGVASRGEQPHSKFILQTDVRDFHASYAGGERTALTSVHARLIDARGRTYAAKLFEARVPIDRDSAAATAIALNDGSRKVIGEIVAWTLDAGEKSTAEPARDAAAQPKTRL